MNESRETQATMTSAHHSGKYLTFFLNAGEFAVGILHVREIIAIQEITPLPRVPEYVRGVINLRGKIIPVVDLRMRLNLDAREYDRATCIIVMEIERPGGVTMNIGCVVDTVSEVIDLRSDQIQAPPSFGNGVRVDYILGMTKHEERVTTLIDIETVLTAILESDDLAGVEMASA